MAPINVKPLVNNPEMWGILDSFLKELYTQKVKELENLSNIQDIYKAQGYIQAIKYLRDTRDRVNAK